MALFTASLYSEITAEAQTKPKTPAASSAVSETISTATSTTFIYEDGRTVQVPRSSATADDINLTWITGSGTGGRVISWRDDQLVETRTFKGKGPDLAELRSRAMVRTAGLRANGAPVGYVTLAKFVGAKVSNEEAVITDAIKDLGLPVYGFAEVDEFLARKALSQGTNARWVWKPLATDGLTGITAAGMAWSNRAGVGIIAHKLYPQLVPMSALATLKSIIALVPNVLPLISDYEVMKPDPFMAITTSELLAAGKIWIIAQWDEPGFGSESTVTSH